MSDSFKILLEESSGPVSPKFFYDLHVEITPAEGGGVVTLRHKRAKELVELARPIAKAQLDVLIAELEKRLTKDEDLVGAMRSRKGVSFNTVSLEHGERHVKVDYLLSHAEGGAHPDLTIAIEAIKAIVTEAEAARDPSKAP